MEEQKENLEKSGLEIATNKSSDNVKLYSGDELSLKDVTLVSYKYKYKMIFIIGDSDSGKTTLLATIFDLFQLGSFKEFLFGGSLTLIGFERRSHLSRITSGLSIPDTVRTTSIEFSFLHLSIKRKNFLEKSGISLLLSDVSGERYKQARNSRSSMDELKFMRNADHLIILVDGGKIADIKQRKLEIFNSQTFIDMALEVGIFNSQTNLNIVLSKWDLLAGDSSFNFSEIIEKPFNERYSQKVKSLKYLKIAARPLAHIDNIFLGHGVHELLSEWIESKPNTPHLHNIPTIDRSFNNYKYIDN